MSGFPTWWLGMGTYEKERFPKQHNSKLDPWEDRPFQVLKCSNNNAYKIDLPEKYNVSGTFNVYDLSPLM